MSQNEKSVADEAKGRRSPISPMLPIDDAIEKARQVYIKDKRAFTDFKTLAGHLGYKVERKGGRSGRTISTLKQYGLLDERAGQYRISDIAWKILEMPESSTERAQLIKEAALNPPVIRKILSYYNGELPSDATLRSYLLFTEKFNVDNATDFIRVLRRTMELVNPSPEDYTDGEASQGAETPRAGETPMQQTTAHQSTPFVPTGSKAQIAQVVAAANAPLPHLSDSESLLVFKLSRDSEARVIFNGQVTQEAIDKLAALLGLSKDAYPTKAELEPQRPAKWLDGITEFPVWASEPYERNGVRFVRINKYGEIKEVPEDDVKFIVDD